MEALTQLPLEEDFLSHWINGRALYSYLNDLYGTGVQERIELK